VRYIEELKKTTAQNASIESDLRIANSIQMGMLPKVFPTKDDRDDVQIYASLTPAKAVGGDLFDFFFRDGKLFFCVGDVSGKGVPGSLFMTVTRAVFRTVSAHESVPNRIMESLNNIIVESNDTSMFVTLFIGVLDLKTGHLLYCNAGHDIPLLVGAGVGKLPCTPNVPVGLFSQWKYVLQETHIFTGTTIFLYTDGLTEAEAAQHQQFKLHRVFEVAKEARAHDQIEPRQLISRMTDAVHQFVGAEEQSDDLTMMAIQYIKPEHVIKHRNTLVLPNDTQQLRKLAAFVQETCEVVGLDEHQTKKIVLALEEAVTNVMLYAYPPDVKGEVRVETNANDLQLMFNIFDSGAPFNPTAMPDADVTLPLEKRRKGGLGIFLIRKLMDHVSYERIEGYNELILIKRLDNINTE
jgi:sigma-B regulation protein RsbU (phosphoserine phosphatase)